MLRLEEVRTMMVRPSQAQLEEIMRRVDRKVWDIVFKQFPI